MFGLYGVASVTDGVIIEQNIAEVTCSRKDNQQLKPWKLLLRKLSKN